jgi:hypothetical protein
VPSNRISTTATMAGMSHDGRSDRLPATGRRATLEVRAGGVEAGARIGAGMGAT